jgi:ubiquitin-activating enzyme E1
MTVRPRPYRPSTEEYFTDDFWENLDLCWNALDNVKARQYTDGRCLWYSKPLLESGTTGTKSNSEVILPFRTSTYNDGEDPPEVAIAMCTLRSFPYLPIHCIEYAKQALWTDTFEFGPTQYEKFRTDNAGFYGSLAAMSKDEERMAAMGFIKKLVDLQLSGEVNFGACVRLAFEQLVATFRDAILAVVNAGDVEEARTGEPYWTGTKRKPNPVEFSLANPMALEYLYTVRARPGGGG